MEKIISFFSKFEFFSFQNNQIHASKMARIALKLCPFFFCKKVSATRL